MRLGRNDRHFLAENGIKKRTFAGIRFADDPSNRDPRFTRVRVRTLLSALAGEGLDARRLSRLAQRMRRADAALEATVDAAALDGSRNISDSPDIVIFNAQTWADRPEEVRLRLLGRAITQTGNECPVELGKLEALVTALDALEPGRETAARFCRTLAGAMVTLFGQHLRIERAPPRKTSRHRVSLTTAKRGKADTGKSR